MRMILKHFKLNKEPKLSDALEILFDFIVVALVSLIFNGFIINSNSSSFDQKFFMVGNAMLLTTHWYAYNFFRQRYEKRTMFFMMWTFVNVIPLAVMAIGIDIMDFKLNQDSANYDFLTISSMVIWLGGYISVRLFMGIQYLLAHLANSEIKSIVQLTIFKYLSRFLIAIIGFIHLGLLLEGFKIEMLTYVFIPIYFVVEFAGNKIGVTQKALDASPKISSQYAKDRDSKLTLLYIASIFISGTIQFAHYFQTPDDFKSLWTMFGAYTIGFLLWWTYLDRAHKFNIKQDAKNLMNLAVINVFIVVFLVIFGAMLINAHNDKNIGLILPSTFFSLAGFLIMLIPMQKALTTSAQGDEITKDIKRVFILQSVPVIIILIAMGILSLTISLPMWSLYATIIPCLLAMGIASRQSLRKHHKKDTL